MRRAWRRPAAAAGAPVGVLLAVLALQAAPARADFTETSCAGGPATQWTTPATGPTPFAGELNLCGTGGSLAFTLNGTQMAPDTSATAGIVMPPGEALTAVNVTYSTTTASGSNAVVFVDSDGTELAGSPTGYTNATYAGPLSDATSFVLSLYCTGSGGSSTDCTFPGFDPLAIGATTLTIHDTGSPSVVAAGGSLSIKGTYSGVQTIGYSATDGGSGVAKVTATLGATVVGTATTTCQSFELSPCPHSTSGVLTVDTTGLRNGTYPLTLTAYDMSGDPTTVAVDTVRVRNTGTVSVAPRRPHRGHVAARVVAGWDWGQRPYTRVTSVHFAHLPRGASVTLSCRGRGCPRARWSHDRRPRSFARRLRGARFRSGDALTLTIRAPHRIAERVRIEIRDGRAPRGRVLR